MARPTLREIGLEHYRQEEIRRAAKTRKQMPKVPALARGEKLADALFGKREAEKQRLIALYGTSRAGHSLFSPSSSAGWLNCMGFVLANAGKPDLAGEDAAYGTVAHGIGATWLTAIRDEGRDRAEHVPKRFLDWSTVENRFRITCDADMIHHLRRYIDWCREVEIEGDVYVEQKVDYSIYTPIPDQGGTADHFVCISPDGDLGGQMVITDLKMGKGVAVFVERNTQAMLYALGVFLKYDWIYDFQRIRIRICQPRLDYFGEWECAREDLLAFGEEVRVKADAGWVVDAPRSPSPKACQWCSDKACPAKSALLEDLADDFFDDDDVIEGEATPVYSALHLDDHSMQPLFGRLKNEPRASAKMSISLMAWRLSHKAMFTKYFREIGEILLELAQSGHHVPGFKVVNGKRSFAWDDPDDAAMELFQIGLPEDAIYVTEVTSVSKATKAIKAEKLLDNKELEKLLYGTPELKVGGKTVPAKRGLVKVGQGKPKLAPSEDNRIDVQSEVDDAFDDDEEDDL